MAARLSALLIAGHGAVARAAVYHRWDLWLDTTVQDRALLEELLVPFPSDQMAARRVSQRVGNVRNQDPDVQGPFEEDDA